MQWCPKSWRYPRPNQLFEGRRERTNRRYGKVENITLLESKVQYSDNNFNSRTYVAAIFISLQVFLCSLIPLSYYCQYCFLILIIIVFIILISNLISFYDCILGQNVVRDGWRIPFRHSRGTGADTRNIWMWRIVILSIHSLIKQFINELFDDKKKKNLIVFSREIRKPEIIKFSESIQIEQKTRKCWMWRIVIITITVY